MRNLLVISAAILLFISSLAVSAQDKQLAPPKVIQFSGIVLDEATSDYMQGVSIFIPERRRGGVTNMYGFFTMPVAVGDSIVFNYVGYERQYLIIPDVEGDAYTVLVELKEDPIQLENIDIFPFPNFRDFKEEVLAMRAPKDYVENIYSRNIDPEQYEAYVRRAAMTPQMNYQYFQQQQMQMQQDRVGPRSFQFLNPFAWSQFIQSLKKKD